MSLYQTGNIILAKCQDYPFWPGIIISVFANQTSYKVLFYGEKSEADIDHLFILPFTEDNVKMSLTQARSNKDLRNAINIAYKKQAKIMKGEISSEDEEFYHNELSKSKVQRRGDPKKGTAEKPKQPPDIHIEFAKLLELLVEQASIPFYSLKKAPLFSPQNEARLRELLIQGNTGLSLIKLIEKKAIQKLIMAYKSIMLWNLYGFGDLPQLIVQKYLECKNKILDKQFQQNDMAALNPKRKETIIQKVKDDRVVLY